MWLPHLASHVPSVEQNNNACQLLSRERFLLSITFRNNDHSIVSIGTDIFHTSLVESEGQLTWIPIPSQLYFLSKKDRIPSVLMHGTQEVLKDVVEWVKRRINQSIFSNVIQISLKPESAFLVMSFLGHASTSVSVWLLLISYSLAHPWSRQTLNKCTWNKWMYFYLADIYITSFIISNCVSTQRIISLE